jgi:choline dehydrogenase-like flavoprotein
MEQVTEKTDLETKVFDYVIVGGGTAGLVIAARLTDNPNVQVCYP